MNDNEHKKSLNEDKPWSDIDTRDLMASVQIGRSLTQTAHFLMRRVDEVEAKIKELNLPMPHR